MALGILGSTHISLFCGSIDVVWTIGEVRWGEVWSRRPRKNSCDVFGAKWWFIKTQAERAAAPGL